MELGFPQRAEHQRTRREWLHGAPGGARVLRLRSAPAPAPAPAPARPRHVAARARRAHSGAPRSGGRLPAWPRPRSAGTSPGLSPCRGTRAGRAEGRKGRLPRRRPRPHLACSVRASVRPSVPPAAPRLGSAITGFGRAFSRAPWPSWRPLSTRRAARAAPLARLRGRARRAPGDTAARVPPGPVARRPGGPAARPAGRTKGLGAASPGPARGTDAAVTKRLGSRWARGGRRRSPARKPAAPRPAASLRPPGPIARAARPGPARLGTNKGAGGARALAAARLCGDTHRNMFTH